MGLRELLAKQFTVPGLPTVISGPSGTGKGTVVRALLERDPSLSLSVSMTTRAPRAGEDEGVHYYFRSRADFEEAVRDGGLLEWAEFCGNYYGTPKEPVERQLNAGRDVILEIDIQGGLSVREAFPRGTTIFLLPPSWVELSRRLQSRNSETDQSMERRLQTARSELTHIGEYDYVVVNDSVETCVDQISAILSTARHRRDWVESSCVNLNWSEILDDR